MGTLHYLRGKDRPPSPPGPPGGDAPVNWGRLAGEMFNKQEWERLESICRRWAKDESDNALPWFLMSHAYGKMGNYGALAPAFSEALRLNDQADCADHCYNTGIYWAIAGLQDKAREWFVELRKYDPEKAARLFKISMDFRDIDMMCLWRETEKIIR